GTYSFALKSSSSTSIVLASKERGAATAAQLVVTEAPSADTTPPTAPTNLAASSATTSSVSLSWSASTDDTGVAGYRIYRDGTLVCNTSTSYDFTGLACGMSYTFGVEAYDVAGNVSPRTTLAASTNPCPSGPRTYYVDSVGGSDLNSGTSETNAWKTLAK